MGSAIELLRSTDPEVLLSGPAGTGKSRACLEKLHLLAQLVPGLRGLMLRRTRASLTESALVTFEEHVIPPGHPCLEGARRLNRHSYHYPNGSELVVGGLDRPGKVMSSEWDVVYVQEATELQEEGWEALTTRLRNATSDGTLGYRQLLADTNPDRPGHWLKLRCDAGRTRLIECRHEDNPRYFDGHRWTPEGIEYIGRLDALTGPRKQRLRFGRWVRAEGVVYENWDAARHVIDPFVIPQEWPRIWVVDFGYTNPFCWQNWALDGDNRLYLTQEIYRTMTLVSDHARRIAELTRGQPLPVAIICDPEDREGRETLSAELGLPTMPADKRAGQKKLGIQAVEARLRVQADGRPRLFVLADCLDGIDPRLEEAKKPWSTRQEFDGYVWDDRHVKETPIDKDNHGMDCVRYLVSALDGPADREDGRQTVYRP